MFLDKTVERNGNLVEFAFDAHGQGLILPDSYIVDVDTFTSNASMILDAAREHGFSLFYMLKQLGRNPYLATVLDDMGYDGAVVVDFREAAVMMDAGVRIGNVGHLVQIPDSMIGDVVSYGVDNITLYSLEKAARIDREARLAGIVQNVLIRVTGEGDMIYSGQTAGFDIASLPSLVHELEGMKNLRIAGVTSFPCYLYDSVAGAIMPTGNLKTVLEAATMLESMGHGGLVVNTPSTTCTRTIAMMAGLGGNCGEPGHGLTYARRCSGHYYDLVREETHSIVIPAMSSPSYIPASSLALISLKALSVYSTSSMVCAAVETMRKMTMPFGITG